MATNDLHITVTVDVPATVVTAPVTGHAGAPPTTGTAAPRPSAPRPA